MTDEFDRYRAEMNERLLGSGHLGIKRFFALDTQAYEQGALDMKTKEVMGVGASPGGLGARRQRARLRTSLADVRARHARQEDEGAGGDRRLGCAARRRLRALAHQ